MSYENYLQFENIKEFYKHYNILYLKPWQYEIIYKNITPLELLNYLHGSWLPVPITQEQVQEILKLYEENNFEFQIKKIFKNDLWPEQVEAVLNPVLRDYCKNYRKYEPILFWKRAKMFH